MVATDADGPNPRAHLLRPVSTADRVAAALVSPYVIGLVGLVTIAVVVGAALPAAASLLAVAVVAGWSATWSP